MAGWSWLSPQDLQPCPPDADFADKVNSKSASHEYFRPSLTLPPVMRPETLPPGTMLPVSFSIFTMSLSLGRSNVHCQLEKGEPAPLPLISTLLTAAALAAALQIGRAHV